MSDLAECFAGRPGDHDVFLLRVGLRMEMVIRNSSEWISKQL